MTETSSPPASPSASPPASPSTDLLTVSDALVLLRDLGILRLSRDDDRLGDDTVVTRVAPKHHFVVPTSMRHKQFLDHTWPLHDPEFLDYLEGLKMPLMNHLHSLRYSVIPHRYGQGVTLVRDGKVCISIRGFKLTLGMLLATMKLPKHEQRTIGGA